MPLWEQLLAEKVLEWSYVRSEPRQGERSGGRVGAGGGGVHSARQGGVSGESWARRGAEDKRQESQRVTVTGTVQGPCAVLDARLPRRPVSPGTNN